MLKLPAACENIFNLYKFRSSPFNHQNIYTSFLGLGASLVIEGQILSYREKANITITITNITIPCSIQRIFSYFEFVKIAD